MYVLDLFVVDLTFLMNAFRCTFYLLALSFFMCCYLPSSSASFTLQYATVATTFPHQNALPQQIAATSTDENGNNNNT